MNQGTLPARRSHATAATWHTSRKSPMYENSRPGRKIDRRLAAAAIAPSIAEAAKERSNDRTVCDELGRVTERLQDPASARGNRFVVSREAHRCRQGRAIRSLVCRDRG